MTPATESVFLTTDKRALHELEDGVALEAEARELLEQTLGWLRSEAQPEAIHQVERRVFAAMMALGRAVLRAFVAHKGDGIRRSAPEA